MNRGKTLRRLRFYGSLALTFLTIGSLAVTTFSWFTIQQTAKVSMSFLKVETNLSCKMKYFRGNYDPAALTYAGYHDIRTLSGTASAKHVTDYANDFVEVPGNQFVAGGPLDIGNLTSGVCHTFAFEIASERESSTPITLDLLGYTSPGSVSKRIYKNSQYSATAITLASAVDAYSTSFVKSNNAGDSSSSDAFITTYMQSAPTDLFTYYDADDAFRTYRFFSGSVPGNSTLCILLTIEFTEESSTFYSYHSVYNDFYYFQRNPLGNSNAYEGLSFQMTRLAISE